MPWFRVDDKFHDHRKTRKVLRSTPKRRDAAALGLWAAAGSWSADNLTDGFIPTDELTRWDDDGLELAGRLVAAGLWHPETLDGEDGFRFHKWEEQQPTREQVERQREAARERMRAVRARGGKGSDGSPDVRANSDGTSHDVRSTPSRPVPSRPAAAAARAGGTHQDHVGDELPPPLEILKSKLDAARMHVRWDRLEPGAADEIIELIAVHGDGPLVKAAIAAHRPDSPAAFAQAWLGIWKALPPPGAGLQLVRARCDTHTAVQLDSAGLCRSCAADSLAAR